MSNEINTTKTQLDENVKVIKICSAIWFLVIPAIIAFVMGILVTVKSLNELEEGDRSRSYYLTVGIVSILTAGVWWISLIVASAMSKGDM